MKMLSAALNRFEIHIALFAILSPSAVYSQSPKQLHFEVASIKPGGDIFSTKPQSSPGRFLWTTQLAYLIGYAYDLDFNRISGKGLGVIYTINAVSKPNASEDEVRRMLQSLLAERFDMRFHRQVKEVDGFAVTVDRGGVKMKESPAGGEPNHGGLGSGTSSVPVNESYVSATMTSPGVTSIQARGASLTQLTRALERIVGRPFWDQTGLGEKYDFAFSFSQDLNDAPQTGVPALPSALRETLGLALHRHAGAFEILVIDHLDKPTDN